MDAAREDNRRARNAEAERIDRADAQAAADRKARAPLSAKQERTTRQIASKSANCCHNALGYLEAALGELDEARSWAADSPDPRLRKGKAEAELHAALKAILDGSGGPSRAALTHLRDVRATRAGFSFDYEG